MNVEGFTMRGNAFVMVTRSHVRVQDIRATCIDLDGVWHEASGNGMFFVWVAPPVNVIDDVEFYECHVVNAHTHGFNMNQDYNDGVCRATTNIRFLNCRAVGCGYGRVGDPGVVAGNQSRSEWITGFDFHEWQDLINCEVVNCVASRTTGSPGSTSSPAPGTTSAAGISARGRSRRTSTSGTASSSNNGQRNTYDGHFFMSGYYLSRDTHLENCQSLNNRNAGFYVHGGANSSFSACTDDGSTYGWKVCKASSDITLTDCSSSNNLRWALWLSFSQRIRVNNFQHDRRDGRPWVPEHPRVVQGRGEVPAAGHGLLSSTSRPYGNPMPIINQAGSGNIYSLTYG